MPKNKQILDVNYSVLRAYALKYEHSSKNTPFSEYNNP